MTCSRCQTINPAGSVACAACGAPLFTMPPAGYAMPPGQPYMVMQAMTPKRSGTPKVMGILMIVFASLGLLGSLASLGGIETSGMEELERLEAFKTFQTMNMVMAVFGLFLGGLHLYAGIRAVGYRANAPRLANTYAIINMVTTAIWMVIFYAWLKPAMDAVPGAGAIFGAAMVFGAAIAMIWPILILALMNSAPAKAACTN